MEDRSEASCPPGSRCASAVLLPHVLPPAKIKAAARAAHARSRSYFILFVLRKKVSQELQLHRALEMAE